MKPYSNGRMGQGEDWAQDSVLMPVVKPERDVSARTPAGALPPRPERRSRQEPPPEEQTPGEQTPGEELESGAQVLSTNRTIRLSCTLAAMLSPFALFLLKAERSSRAIRHNSLQSAALGIIHVTLGLLCLGLGISLGQLPGIGAWITLACWMTYGTVLVSVTAVRLRLMRHAWQGLRYDLPLLGWWLERFE